MSQAGGDTRPPPRPRRAPGAHLACAVAAGVLPARAPARRRWEAATGTALPDDVVDAVSAIVAPGPALARDEKLDTPLSTGLARLIQHG